MIKAKYFTNGPAIIGFLICAVLVGLTVREMPAIVSNIKPHTSSRDDRAPEEKAAPSTSAEHSRDEPETQPKQQASEKARRIEPQPEEPQKMTKMHKVPSSGSRRRGVHEVAAELQNDLSNLATEEDGLLNMATNEDAASGVWSSPVESRPASREQMESTVEMSAMSTEKKTSRHYSGHLTGCDGDTFNYAVLCSKHKVEVKDEDGDTEDRMLWLWFECEKGDEKLQDWKATDPEKSFKEGGFDETSFESFPETRKEYAECLKLLNSGKYGFAACDGTNINPELTIKQVKEMASYSQGGQTILLSSSKGCKDAAEGTEEVHGMDDALVLVLTPNE